MNGKKITNLKAIVGSFKWQLNNFLYLNIILFYFKHLIHGSLEGAKRGVFQFITLRNTDYSICYRKTTFKSLVTSTNLFAKFSVEKNLHLIKHGVLVNLVDTDLLHLKVCDNLRRPFENQKQKSQMFL